MNDKKCCKRTTVCSDFATDTNANEERCAAGTERALGMGDVALGMILALDMYLVG
jgi:hypothetical protein